MVNNKEKSLIFIGFMGAGKTTVGKLVADKSNRRFIDTDEEIEKEFNLPISEIFQQYGEKAFRDKEKSLITSLCQDGNLVLSPGGGAFLQEDIRLECLSSGIVIFLDLSFDAWKDRMGQVIDTRPLLNGKNMDEIESLFNYRQHFYAKHHLRIQTDAKSPEEIADEVLIRLQDLTRQEGWPS